MKPLLFNTVFLIIFLLVNTAGATPLRFDYTVTPIDGGRYDYEFRLTLDNNDNSWMTGQGWQWIVFGDSPDGDTSPLTDFVGDTSDFPTGPYTGFGTTNIDAPNHVGPTLENLVHFWRPTAVGQYLQWSGTSTANLGAGELLISTIGVDPGNGDPNTPVPATYLAGNRVNTLDPVPEPGTFMLLGMGLLGLFSMGRSNLSGNHQWVNCPSRE